MDGDEDEMKKEKNNNFEDSTYAQCKWFKKLR